MVLAVAVACRLLQPLCRCGADSAPRHNHTPTAWRHSPERGKNSWGKKSYEGKKKKLVRLKKPRLPSALGLSGACGVAA
eukprot:scaffold5017_cov139-Isochrysis_galbana.AAC.1